MVLATASLAVAAGVWTRWRYCFSDDASMAGAAQVCERSFRAQPLGIVAGSDEQRACAVGPDAGQLDERRRGRRDQGRSYALHDACRANPPCKRAVSARLRR